VIEKYSGGKRRTMEYADLRARKQIAADSIQTIQVEPAEVQKLAKAFKDPSEIQGNGLYIGKQKYMVVLANDRSIYGKLVRTFCRRFFLPTYTTPPLVVF